MAERALPPHDISPHAFFTEWIGRAVGEDLDRRKKLGDTDAIVEFTLEGEGGGIFTLKIAGGAVSGSAGPAEDANLRVRLDVETWRKLNAREVTAPEALLRRNLHLRGNFVLGLKLHLILG